MASIENDKYINNFDQIDEIGEGGFGVVFKVMDKRNKHLFAIKRIEMEANFDNNLKEISILSKLSDNFVVRYFDSWIEENTAFRNQTTKYLFIQMELCSQSLRDVIKEMKTTFEERFEKSNFFISCELFRELTECVNYLHRSEPPIIHRDLKPDNVLISDGQNGHFIKLCDFGLAKIHENSFHSRNVGTFDYMAPEVYTSNHYNQKSDIYSMALIATQIFQFEDCVRDIRKQQNLDQYLQEKMNSDLKTNYLLLVDALAKCLYTDDYHNRPDCQTVLEIINNFCIDKNQLDVFDKLNFIESLEEQQPSNLQTMNFLKVFFENKVNESLFA